MKDSIGGVWLMGIVIVFIALFSSFLAYSISYTKAFRTKNEIINIIERNEGFTTYNGAANLSALGDMQFNDQMTIEGQQNKTEVKAFAFIRGLGYNWRAAEQVECFLRGEDIGTMMPGGYCLKRYCPVSGESDKVYYKVTTFTTLEIPFLGLVFRLPISGETKALYYDVSVHAPGAGGCRDL